MEKRKIYEKNGIAIPTVVIIVVVSIILVAVPTVIIISLINKSMLITESEVDKEGIRAMTHLLQCSVYG